MNGMSENVIRDLDAGILTEAEADEILAEIEALEREGEETDLPPAFAGLDLAPAEFDDADLYEAERHAESAFEAHFDRIAYENEYLESLELSGLR